ncbi:hypothetical protein [Fulvivirga sediminis]|uniref:Uncharacterized protein n=1 Tax=Fulvivirga sediminis TaxID=2803949 RepID=A0A937FC13_9BACT|nr:hypothetical protein [Fulvivirga sediminis]MBL3658424.1 hypothetical protein [Fulvivirga sediminis]
MDRNPDIIEYISRYCHNYWTDLEKKASEHHIAQTKFLPHKDRDSRFGELYRCNTSTDPNVLELLRDGYSSFLETVANRIYDQHLNELELNRCPNCKGIARTPTAKQCRYCGHDWH